MRTYHPADHERQPDFASRVQPSHQPASLGEDAGAATLISSTNPTLNLILPLRPSSPGLLDRGNVSHMDVDGASGNEDRTRRDTSVLSMDDIEAAQALEGLRSGTACVWSRSNP